MIVISIFSHFYLEAISAIMGHFRNYQVLLNFDSFAKNCNLVFSKDDELQKKCCIRKECIKLGSEKGCAKFPVRSGNAAVVCFLLVRFESTKKSFSNEN